MKTLGVKGMSSSSGWPRPSRKGSGDLLSGGGAGGGSDGLMSPASTSLS